MLSKLELTADLDAFQIFEEGAGSHIAVDCQATIVELNHLGAKVDRAVVGSAAITAGLGGHWQGADNQQQENSAEKACPVRLPLFLRGGNGTRHEYPGDAVGKHICTLYVPHIYMQILSLYDADHDCRWTRSRKS